ncbi:uncharacterized protein LOC132519091 [Lagenorhynchus albirostris]|uniref:uncharacterized protein LOC132519091 n=1 Tax=Lagenorhynchus albirostris TaxID=27610 RepID=UPI0028EAF542|nr:uncharacterized protein LOC132519091 [Lagenorhynchus albirostris]
MRRPGKPTGGRHAPGPPGGAPLTGSAHASAARFPSPSGSRVFPFLSRSPQAEAVIALLLGACVISDPRGLRRLVLCSALSCGGVPGCRRRLPLPWAARLRDPRQPPAVQENRDLPGAPSLHRLLESRGGGAWSAEGAAEPGSVNFGSGRLWCSPWIRGARRRERRVSCMRDPEAKKQTLSLLKSNSFCECQEKIFGCWRAKDFFPLPMVSLAFCLLGLEEGICEGDWISRLFPSPLLQVHCFSRFLLEGGPGETGRESLAGGGKPKKCTQEKRNIRIEELIQIPDHSPEDFSVNSGKA